MLALSSIAHNFNPFKSGIKEERTNPILTVEAKEHYDLLKREKISPNFKITVGTSLFCTSACGLYQHINMDTPIEMWPGLKEVDKHAYNFSLLRKFYYFKPGVIYQELYAVIAIVVSFAIVYFSTSNLWISLSAVCIAPLVACRFLYRKLNANADDFAVKNATYPQLEGGIRYLRALKEVRKTIAQRLQIRINDETLVGHFPSIKSRMEKIEKEINHRISMGTAKRMPQDWDTEQIVKRMAKIILKHKVNFWPLFNSDYNYLLMG